MTNQALIMIIFFLLLWFVLALYTKSASGRFLARIPRNKSDYQVSQRHQLERKIGLAFAGISYRIIAVALPLALIIYDSLVTRLMGTTLAIGIGFYLVRQD